MSMREECHLKYGFYISGKSGRLKKFLQLAKDEYIAQIQIVISDFKIEYDLLSLLDHLKIPVEIIEYGKIDGENNKEKNRILSDFIFHKLDKYRIDYLFSFGSHILSGELLVRYQYHLINFHPSLLPMYPGQKAIDQALAAGNTFLVGNTAHFIDEGVDTGAVIMQSVVPLQMFYDSDKDYDQILNLQVQMLNQLFDIINKNCLQVNDAGEVRIIGADYSKYFVYPFWNG